MSFAEIETLLRAQFEPLQYAAFFGVFAVFAVLEAVRPRDAAAPQRLWRWPANWILTALNIAILTVIPVSAIAAADFAAGEGLVC